MTTKAAKATAAAVTAVAILVSTAAVVTQTDDAAVPPFDVCKQLAWPIPAICLQPGSALTFQLKPNGPYFVMTSDGMTTLEGRPTYLGPDGAPVVTPSTKAPGLDPGTVAVVPLYNNNAPQAIPATVPLTLAPIGGYRTYRASWPAAAGATSYRIWQDGIVTGITTLNPVSLSLPCGKRSRSNIGPLNATGAAKLAPPVYTDVPPC